MPTLEAREAGNQSSSLHEARRIADPEAVVWSLVVSGPRVFGRYIDTGPGSKADLCQLKLRVVGLAAVCCYTEPRPQVRQPLTL